MQVQLIKSSAYQWHLETGQLYEGQLLVINWLVFLPEKMGTKHQREYLLKSAKGLLSAMVDHSVGRARFNLSSGTVQNWWRQLGALTRWMVHNDIWTYAELTLEDCRTFIKCRRPKKRTSDVVTINTVTQYALHFRRMWELRSKYVSPLAFNPDAVNNSIFDNSFNKLVPFKSIPEEAVIPLIADALDWVSTYGEYLEKTVEKLWLNRSKLVGYTKLEKIKIVRKLFQDLGRDEVFLSITAKLDMKDANEANIFARAMTVTEGAVIIAILFLVGMRAQELIRLDVGCVRVDRENDEELPYLDGIAAKAGGLARSWIAGKPLPEVVAFLVRLFALPRRASGCMALFIGRPSGSGMPIPGRKVARMTAACLTSKMVAFAHAHFRKDRPEIGSIHPHMARKTFAKFVVLRDKTALEALSLHFGHAYKYFTDGAYIGADFQLAQLIDEEDRKELARGLEDMLTSKWSAGKARNKIADAIAIANDEKFKGRLTLKTKIDALIARGVQLGPCDWGYCIYSESLSACHGDASGPNPIERAPDVCANCANLLITEKHAFWWNQRLAREEKFLKREDLPFQTRLVVEKRISITRKLLATAISTSAQI
ncbi:hypothetical protein SAMN05216303_11421 [Rhodoferax sp. OV413]|uniref:site-specific integrase n=1 Tax=Rhodoferax sp. OV413 TaxID=1855285 RepID=UPI00088EE8AA|nr:site-specific integrase [Rhodoferax sp. OV413]SDP94302.1 hypothetical protein SAMN05216303_11421 [Rhodoferax sp. OV413]